MSSSWSALSLLWTAWLLSWLLASGWTSRTLMSQSAAARIVQSLPIWIGAILIFRTPRRLITPIVPPSALMHWGAFGLTALGLALTWWARIHLGRFWSAAVTVKAGHVLIRSGPYALTRHPIYTGLLLALMATAVARDSAAGLIGVGLVAFGLVLKLRQEEQFLRGQFGAAYETYSKEVPALIPGLW